MPCREATALLLYLDSTGLCAPLFSYHIRLPWSKGTAGMDKQVFQQWNYFILKLNIAPPRPQPSPEEASKKLKGALSPAFIQDQFPQEYKDVKPGIPLEQQIQKLLDKLGKEGWELINISTVGGLLMFFFKRPGCSDSPLS